MNKVPNLRFKEFSGEWERKKFRDIVWINQGLQIAISDRYSEDGENRFFYITNEFLNKNSDKKYYIKNPPSNVICKKTDILMTRTGNTGRVVTGVAGAFHNNFFKINYDSNQHSQMFLYYVLTSFKVQKNIIRLAGTSTIPDLNHGDFYNIKVSYPSLKEQEKIAAFFSLIDKKIALQTEKVEELKNYKKGLLQKIFSQELRFKDENGNEYPEWEIGRLEDVISSCLQEVKKPSKPYWRLGIRSHGKGTFHEYVDDPNKVAMDKLYEVKNDMLIVNITFAWEHAIAVTTEKDEGKLVSHRFPTYVFKENALKHFYKYYILQPRFKKYLLDCSPGGAGRNRVLNKRAFLEIPIIIPSLEEQKKISGLLMSADEKIEKEQEKLEQLQEYKKGLFQQMFI